jgi:hypothetical protein
MGAIKIWQLFFKRVTSNLKKTHNRIGGRGEESVEGGNLRVSTVKLVGEGLW